jgi:hypothetical protein
MPKENIEEARLLRLGRMVDPKILAELDGRDQIEEAILQLERLARDRGRGAGRPPNWMAEVPPPKRRGKSRKSKVSGSNDPGSQPPPAAPAAARIAGRLDRTSSPHREPKRPAVAFLPLSEKIR